MASADMADRVQRTADDPEKPRKIPAAELAARKKAVKDELVGVKFVGPMEPSNTLIYKLIHIQERGELRFQKLRTRTLTTRA